MNTPAVIAPSSPSLYDKFTDPLAACEKLGNWIAKSGMFGCTKPEQGQVIALTCMSERISVVDFARTYDVMHDGRIRKKALASLVDFRRAGGKHRWITTVEDVEKAEIELTFEGNTIKSKFTIADAKRMGASFKEGSAWVKTPGNMLRARAASNGIAMLCPEVFAGEQDDSMAAPEAAPLNLAVSAQTTQIDTAPVAVMPTPAAKTEPAPIEVVATVNPDEKVEAAMGLAPVIADAPTLPPEKLDALEKAIFSANERLPVGVKLPAAQLGTKAIEWLVAKGKLKAGQMLEHVSPAFCETILAKPDEFAKAISK